MKRTVLKVLIASILLQSAGNAVAAQRSFLQSSLKTVKSVFALAVAAGVTAVAYKAWKWWTTNKVIANADKAMTRAQSPIVCPYTTEPAMLNKQIENRNCVFVGFQFTPALLFQSSQEVLKQIRHNIDNEVYGLCDAEGNPVKGKSYKDMATTLLCDEMTLRHSIAQMEMNNLVELAYKQACETADLIQFKYHREQPWIRSAAVQKAFDDAFAKSIQSSLENHYKVVKNVKNFVLGATEQAKADRVILLCQELDRVKTLQYIINQEELKLEDARKKVKQADADAKYAQELAQTERKLEADEAMARKLHNQENPGHPLPAVKPAAKRPTTPSAPGGISFRN